MSKHEAERDAEKRLELAEPEVEAQSRVARLRAILPQLLPFTRRMLPLVAQLHPLIARGAPLLDMALGAAGGAGAAQANALRGLETRVSGAVDSVGRAQAGVERMVREQGLQIAGLELRLKQLQIAAEDSAAEQTALRLELLQMQRWFKALSAGLAVCGVLLIALVVLWLVRRG
jgi:hypothetical protein